jgi:uncharacterized coiled-coil protein SlyX
METANAKTQDNKMGSTQRRIPTNDNLGFDLTGAIISAAGALGLDYIFFIKPLQDKIETYIKIIDALKNDVIEHSIKLERNAEKISELEQKLFKIEEHFKNPANGAQLSGVSPHGYQKQEKKPPFLFTINNTTSNPINNSSSKFTL